MHHQPRRSKPSQQRAISHLPPFCSLRLSLATHTTISSPSKFSMFVRRVANRFLAAGAISLRTTSSDKPFFLQDFSTAETITSWVSPIWWRRPLENWSRCCAISWSLRIAPGTEGLWRVSFRTHPPNSMVLWNKRSGFGESLRFGIDR